MATAAATTTQWTWSEDVLTFAVEHGFDQFLQPVLDMTLRALPSARHLTVRLEPDPEIADYWYVVFRVEVAGMTVDEMIEAENCWSCECFAIRPFCAGSNMVLSLESAD